MKEYTIISNCRTQNVKEIPIRKTAKDVSVVVPSYNESGNIIPLIERVSKALKKYNFEIIIVDDASIDNTQEILGKRANTDRNVVAIFRKGIRGIWSAQLDGTNFASGKTIVYMDADLSHPPEVIPELLKFIPEYDFVSASRYIGSGGMKGIPLKHMISTKIFNFGMKVIMGLSATDYTGVFHAIKKEKLMQILPKKNALAGEFDLDLLYYAKKNKLKFKELPFTYIYRIEGKSKSRKMSSLAYIYGKRAVKLRLFGSA